MSLARSIVTTLSLLLLAVPSLAQDFDWAQPAEMDWADRSEMPSNGFLDGATRATIEAESCCAPASNGKWPDEKEAVLLKQLDGKVARDDRTLRLALEGGRNLAITDCPNQDACGPNQSYERTHRLVGWWPTHRYYFVSGRYSGWEWVYMISEKDGRTTSISAVPVVSPSGRYAVALMSSPVSSVHLHVIDFTSDPPKTLMVARPTCAGVRWNALLRPNPVWIDDSSVRFEGDLDWPGYTGGALYTGKQLLRIGTGRPRWEC